MKVQIVIDVEFPDGFKPPEAYDIRRCIGCPFDSASDMDDWCVIADGDERCPIKHFFTE